VWTPLCSRNVVVVASGCIERFHIRWRISLGDRCTTNSTRKLQMLLGDRNGLGTFAYRKGVSSTRFTLNVLAGTLLCRSCEISAPGQKASVLFGSATQPCQLEKRGERSVVTLNEMLTLSATSELRIEVHA